VTKIISVTIMNLVTPTAGAKHELLFNEPASGSPSHLLDIFIMILMNYIIFNLIKSKDPPGNTKGGSITVLLTSCLTGLDLSVLQIKTKIVSCHTADSKPVKQEVNGTMILPPLIFLGSSNPNVEKLSQVLN
jgi:hypothetical protein